MITLLVSILAGITFGTFESIRITRRNPGVSINTIHQAGQWSSIAHDNFYPGNMNIFFTNLVFTMGTDLNMPLERYALGA